jgi:phosphoribosylglycinamide formyltransferase 1
MRIAVLLSGAGLTLKALLQANAEQRIQHEFVAVIADRPAAGLQLASDYQVPNYLCERSAFANKAAFETALAEHLECCRPELIVLAGFMRILSATFTARFAGKMINLHPSLLPKYPGLDTHARALAAGETEHGATVHWVTAELDGGPIISQAKLAIASDDTAETLAARIKALEQALLVSVLADVRLLTDR